MGEGRLRTIGLKALRLLLRWLAKTLTFTAPADILALPFNQSSPIVRKTLALFLFAAISSIAAEALAVTMAWSPVGNPGNTADSADGDSFAPGIQHLGSVPYSYRIATYDVTNRQYAEFLNTKDPSGANALRLWNGQMVGSGITFNSGNLPGSKYVLTAANQNHPVTNVTWYSAIRFANWLNNGQGSGDTETGAYTLGALGAGGIPTNGNSIVRNAGAIVFLPTENEWYKAAYYDPKTSSYNLYATSSNLLPTASGPTALANHANYIGAVGNLTDVGAYSGTMSPYGLFDMAGNAFQWNETFFSANFSTSRGARGSAYGSPDYVLLSSAQNNTLPTWEINSFGFRVAAIANIPEPSSIVLAALGFIGLAWAGRRGHFASAWRR